MDHAAVEGEALVEASGEALAALMDAVKQVDGTLSWSVTETDPTGRKPTVQPSESDANS